MVTEESLPMSFLDPYLAPDYYRPFMTHQVLSCVLFLIHSHPDHSLEPCINLVPLLQMDICDLVPIIDPSCLDIWRKNPFPHRTIPGTLPHPWLLQTFHNLPKELPWSICQSTINPSCLDKSPYLLLHPLLDLLLSLSFWSQPAPHVIATAFESLTSWSLKLPTNNLVKPCTLPCRWLSATSYLLSTHHVLMFTRRIPSNIEPYQNCLEPLNPALLKSPMTNHCPVRKCNLPNNITKEPCPCQNIAILKPIMSPLQHWFSPCSQYHLSLVYHWHKLLNA